VPTHSLLNSYPTCYKVPKKYALVLSCVDARLLDDLVSFLDHDNLTNRYYHVTLPGASLGLTEKWMDDDPTVPNDDTPDAPEEPQPKKSSECEPCYVFNLGEQFARWRLTFIDQVRAAIILTKGQLSDVYIVQHEDCGAFREFIKKDSSDLPDGKEIKMHKEYAEALIRDITTCFECSYSPKDNHGKVIQKEMPNLHAFYMDLRGKVTHLSTDPEDPADPLHSMRNQPKTPKKKTPPKKKPA